MEPTIYGRRPELDKSGDDVLVTKWFRRNKLKRNDLVLVNMILNGTTIKTIRRIENIPGDIRTVENASKIRNIIVIPDNQYYLSAEFRMGIGSRDVGLFPEKAIIGKVVNIMRN